MFSDRRAFAFRFIAMKSRFASEMRKFSTKDVEKLIPVDRKTAVNPLP